MIHVDKQGFPASIDFPHLHLMGNRFNTIILAFGPQVIIRQRHATPSQGGAEKTVPLRFRAGLESRDVLDATSSTEYRIPNTEYFVGLHLVHY